ncbi:alpha/beta hydrolase [Paenibacillus physcomitrellae]|uniref:Ferri-bacillibactin esterase BesA n=1 Tax=Paenibacillus physcomitrellae TaxID=1619311 RepID=A0ABQ1FTA5_9BACL|nr:alpha/beta hydrolase-fold protein [Paenibacillus physcomitrellae]GGA30078.1 ferri-bacillibactin esterase BesA [Paenibacillus physcomitrellae]
MNMQNRMEQVSIPGTRQWDIFSEESKRAYRIFIYIPAAVPPPGGFPVIYALDGNAVFGTLVESLKVQSRRPDKTGVEPAVVVGIGYQTEEPFSPDRTYDFTLPRPEGAPPYAFKGRTFAEEGGAELFMRFLQQELKPEIEKTCPVNRNRQSLIGHSLGGLFVLQTLLIEPDSFQCYIAGSPSIHWNEAFIFEEEQRLGDKLKQSGARVKLMVAAGELETAHKMIENAALFSKCVEERRHPGLQLAFKTFDNEGHVSVLAVLMSHAVRFALQNNGV